MAVIRVPWKVIDRDPSTWGASASLRDLVSVLRLASSYYYDRGTGRISDKSFDELRDILVLRRPDHPFLSEVGAAVVKGKRDKELLPFPMYSLDKIKADAGNIDSFAKQFPGPYTVSDKLDGASVEVVWDEQSRVSAFTRGDGKRGQNISKKLAHFRGLPKNIRGPLAVRFEAILSKAAFAEHFADKYENARNLASGVLNKLSAHEATDKVTLVAHSILDSKLPQDKQLAKLQSLGFTVVPHTIVKTLSAESLSRILKARRQKSKYEIDGLVVTQNKAYPQRRGNPVHSKAFKELVGEGIAKSEIVSITWNISKGGLYKPQINIKPVRLAGVTIRNITGHNAWFIEHGYRYKDRHKGLPVRPLGPGAVVNISRSGEVIPHVVEVLKGVRRPSMPDVGYTYGKNNVEIKAADDENKDLERAKRLTFFFTTLGVDFVKLGTVQKLVEHGFDTVAKILRATEEDLLSIPGFQATSVSKLRSAIVSKTRSAPMEKLLAASQIFGNGFGVTKFELLVKAYGPKIMLWENHTAAEIARLIAVVPKFSAESGRALAPKFAKFFKWLRAVRIKPEWPTAVKITSNALKGQSVCFTGFRDEDLKKKIIQAGGTIASGVNAKTTILLVASHDSSSAKYKKASDLGLKIYDETEFLKRYRI